MTNLTEKSKRIAAIRQLVGEVAFSKLNDCGDTGVSGCGIYIILNTFNGCVYVGQSIAVSQRLREHIRLLVAGKHINQGLQHDWLNHGLAHFVCGMLEAVHPIGELLDTREDAWIAGLQALDPSKGYNLKINGTAGSVTFSPCESVQLKEWVGIRRLSDGFWCATALCEQFEKRADNWVRLPFIQENLDLVQMPDQHPDKGIWCHPDLMIDLTSWISPRLYIAYMSHLRSIAGDDIIPKAFKALGFDLH